MGCTSDEPYLSLDTAFTRIYARIMKKELNNNTIIKDIHDIPEQTRKQDDSHEFNLLFKTKYEFKYDEFDRLSGNMDWDKYIDNIYEKRKDYLRDVNMMIKNVLDTCAIKPKYDRNYQNNEETSTSSINLVNKKRINVAAIEILLKRLYLIVYRARKAYKREFMERLKHISNNNPNLIRTNEIIIISSDEEDIEEVPIDDKLIDTENWTFQYQDTRMFGLDTEEYTIEERNERQEYLNWIKSEINTSNDKEYKLSLILQEAYIKFNPNNVQKSISFGIEIYKTLQNTIFENYIEDIIVFYTNFNLEQILLLKNYEIFGDIKLNKWLTKEIDKNNILQHTIRISISTDTHKSKDITGSKSEESSEKITEAK